MLENTDEDVCWSRSKAGNGKMLAVRAPFSLNVAPSIECRTDSDPFIDPKFTGLLRHLISTSDPGSFTGSERRRIESMKL
jgi:hypothetical protein